MTGLSSGERNWNCSYNTAGAVGLRDVLQVLQCSQMICVANNGLGCWRKARHQDFVVDIQQHLQSLAATQHVINQSVSQQINLSIYYLIYLSINYQWMSSLLSQGVGVCLPVRLSQSAKRLNLTSTFFNHLTAHHSGFLRTKLRNQNSDVVTSTGAVNTAGYEKFAIFDK